jgi:hypothetical protein
MSNKTTYLLIVVGLAVLAVFAYALTRAPLPATPESEDNSTPAVTEPQAEAAATEVPAEEKSVVVPALKRAITYKAPATPIYADVVKQYGDYRFQFSNNCRGVSPNGLVMKKGKKFMLDNKDGKTHIFTVDKQKYTVKAYGYAIATASVLGKQFVLCDGIQTASLNVVP